MCNVRVMNVRRGGERDKPGVNIRLLLSKSVDVAARIVSPHLTDESLLTVFKTNTPEISEI